MAAQVDFFQERLRRRGFRMTAERRAILERVVRSSGHFDADSLLRSLRADGESVSRATVYRTIGHLVDAGLLRKYDLGDRHTQYEPAVGKEHHEHMICVVCGEILEFVEKRIETLQDEVCRRHDFRPLSHTLHIHGICAKCDRRQERGDVHDPADPVPAV
jgi:Fur family ferric uptake transcriptional regulator